MECAACRGVGEVMKYVLPGQVGMTKCLQCGGSGVVADKKKPYSPPKLTEYPVTGKMHKAAIEAAKCEARVEQLEQVIDMLGEGHDVDLPSVLLTLREWQNVWERDKRKALDAFVVLVQEKLRAETAQRL